MARAANIGQEPGKAKAEWSWSDEPLLLPLAYERREWNAVYIAFFIAECVGASVRIVHAKIRGEDAAKAAEFRSDIAKFASKLKVKASVDDVEITGGAPSVRDIAELIVQQASAHCCQAIVMSAHREPFFRELFGRVSDHVTRSARQKVVLVETPYPGLTIPTYPKRILVPILRADVDPQPFILAAALTSSASLANVEAIAAMVVKLPPTTPLDAVDIDDTLKRKERMFSATVGSYIQALGRLFTPRILAVRDIGRDVGDFARESGVDVMVMASDKPSGFRPLVTRDEYDIVKNAPCVVLVVFSERKT